MTQDTQKPQQDDVPADAYYGDDDIDLDLSFLDQEEDDNTKK